MKNCTLLLCAILFSVVYAFAQSVTIKVKVVDEQNFNLPGANAVVEGSRITAISDNTGTATLYNVPEGTHELTVSYIGYQSYKNAFTASKQVTELRVVLHSGVTTLKEVVVLGDRLKGQARALNLQKNSDNITNIISADQIGRFPDANIGDAIKRVPGITMQNDQGEARNIVIRGMGPEFNAVTLNGERIPSAEGDNRRVQMDLIPSDMIQTVEVNKTLTADMDADAIGGSVNLVTRVAPNGLRISGTLSGGYNPIRETFIGSGNVVIGNRFFNNKLGAVISGSYQSNKYGSDNVEAEWQKDASGKPFVIDNDVRVYDEFRIRRSVAATFDFKINPLNTIYLTGSYNWRDDKENRYRLRHRYRGDPEDYANDLIYDAKGNIVSYTNNSEIIRQTKGGVGNNRNDSRRLEDQRVRSIALNGDHLLGKLKTTWNVQYARASEKRPNERYISFGVRDVPVSLDLSNPERPLLTDNTPLIEYTRLSELTEQFQNQYEEDLNAKLNFELPLSLINNQKGRFFFGGRIRVKHKVRDNSFSEYEPVESYEENFDNISLFPLIDRTSSKFYPGSQYVAGQFISGKSLGSLNFTNSALFEQSDVPGEYLAGNYNAKETITAAYVMLKQNITPKLLANIGFRIEHTSMKYTGNVVLDEEGVKDTTSPSKPYTNYLPNINLKYNITNNFVIKAAYTQSIARPRYYDLVPYLNLLPGDEEMSAGNTNLKPVTSNNLDLMAENYFKSVGLVSGGLFYKKLNSFFYTYIDDQYSTEKFAADFPSLENPIPEDENWDFSQRRNGESATVWGAEIAFQRQLDFLRGFWKGFGVYLNYTYTHSKADAINALNRNVKLPGAAPHMFNASLSYETKKLVLRVSGNYTSSYVDDSDDGGYNEDAFYDRYYDRQFFLDANGSYAITSKFRVFAEANNLTNQPLRYYQGVKERTAQLEFYGPRFNFGVKFDVSK